MACQPAGDDGVETGREGVGVEPGQRADRVERGFLPEDRGDGEDVLGRLREPGDPAADRALRGLRDHLGHGRARAAASRAISETKSGLPLVRPATAAASSGPTC